MSNTKHKYEEIVDSIKNKIATAVYSPNDLLPSETSLCAEYNSSRITVRKAISILFSEGYLYSVQGKGNYIKNVKKNKFKIHYSHRTIFENGYDEAKLISSALVPPDVHMVYNLNISPEEKVVALKWLIYENNLPIAYDEKFIPYFAGINISENSLKYQDFSKLVSNRISPYEIYQEIKILGINADEVICEKLNVDRDHVLLLIEAKIFDQSGLPFGWGKLYILPEKTRFFGETQ